MRKRNVKNKSTNLLQNKEKLIKLPISKFIDTKFREYAIYVLEQRGIPNFYDALTPVQRYILKNAPNSFNKTLTLVGKCIECGYHHGNAALESSIARLARPFGNSFQLLEGDGFFGTEVSPLPAAARYTGIKLSSNANKIINKYDHLTTKEPEGPYDPLWVEIPIGLSLPVIGIAVGYKSMILPRNLKHVEEFLAGKRKSVKPYFEGFTGKIEKYKELGNAWLISANMEVTDNRISINSIPPIVKYESVLKKLDYLINKYESNIRIIDNSNNVVDLTITYTGKNSVDWTNILKYVEKAFSIIVSENVVFIKDSQVLVYRNVEEYLEDFKWQLIRLKQKNAQHEFERTVANLDFNVAKEKFIPFMLSKKRTDKEVTEWLKDYVKDIRERLERMTARKFTIDELHATKEIIKELHAEGKTLKKQLKEITKEFESHVDPTLARGIHSEKSNVDLFDTDDIEIIDGITIWNGSDGDECEIDE